MKRLGFFARLSRIKKIILILLLLFIAALIAVRYIQTTKIKPVDTAIVTRGEIKEELALSGKIEADEHVDLSFQTGGLLAWVGVKEGDTVQKNQVLASLDTRQTRKTLEKYLNSYMKTRWDFEQTKTDYTDTSEIGLTQDIRDRAKRILEKSQFDLNNAVADVEFQNLAVTLASLTTPIEGVVTRIDTPFAGMNVLVTQQPFEVINPKTFFFQVTADQTEVVQLQPGQKATIVLDSFPNRSLEAQVERISYVPKQDETGTVYAVHTKILDQQIPWESLRLGMTGDATFVTARKTDALTVPMQYVKTDDKGKFVYVTSQRRKTYVTTGLESSDRIEITSGLTDGERVYD